MDTMCLYSLNNEILDKYREKQTENTYQRTVDGNSELIGYPPDSTVRFWFNDEPSEYAVHWHSAFEMVIPLENTYTAILGQKTYELVPGDIFIIPGGELHQLIAPPHRDALYLSL